MLLLLFKSILCLNYKCEYRWVYMYYEKIEISALEQLIQATDIIGVKMKLENPFERHNVEHRVSSSLVQINRYEKYIRLKFLIFDYKDFDFMKRSFFNILLFTEFNFEYINKNGEQLKTKVGGFLVPNNIENSRGSKFYHFSRSIDQIKYSRHFETILIGRIFNLIDLIKSYSNLQILEIVKCAKNILQNSDGDEKQRDLYLELCDLLAVISENRRNSRSLGIILKKEAIKVERNPILKEYAYEILPLIRKLEELFEVYYYDDINETKSDYSSDSESDEESSLVNYTTCFFKLFDMLAYMNMIVSLSIKMPSIKTEVNPILSYHNYEIYNTSITKDRGAKIFSSKVLYIVIKDENGEPCTENVKVMIKILEDLKVLNVFEIDYLGKPLDYDLTNVWPTNATDVKVEIK